MKALKINLKSNKGFTMQDLAIAVIIIILFAGTIGGSYIAIFKVQGETQLSAVATLYAIQIMENIDKIAYDEVITGMETNYRNNNNPNINVPDAMGLTIKADKYNEEDTIKMVTLTITYGFTGSKEELVLEKIKVKEL